MAHEHDETERRSGERTDEDNASERPSETPASEDPKESSEAEEAAAADAERKPEAKAKKAKKNKSNTAEIRDRNARVRAEAAEKRRGKREGTRAKAQLDASEVVDDALARSTHAAAAFFKRHINVLQWVILGGIAIWVGFAIYSWKRNRAVEKETDLLMAAVTTENARVGTGEAAPDKQTGLTDTRPSVATVEERAKKAAEAYRTAANGSTSTATMAKLGLAGILYDQGKYAEAKQAYEEVKQSKLAIEDKDVKGRALEGIGMSAESLNKKDEALKAYRELENLDVPGFVVLGMYHQARVLHLNGESEKAKELLKKADEKLKKADADKKPIAASYVAHSVRELMKAIDPKAAMVAPGQIDPAMLEGLTEGGGDPAQAQQRLQELLKQLQQKQPPAPGAPAPPASAP